MTNLGSMQTTASGRPTRAALSTAVSGKMREGMAAIGCHGVQHIQRSPALSRTTSKENISG